MSDCRDFDIWFKANGRAGLSAIIWIMTPVPDGGFLMANQQPVMVVRSDKGYLLTTDKLSNFWQSHVTIMLGKRRLESADCPDSSYCILPLASHSEVQYQTRPNAGLCPLSPRPELSVRGGI